MLSTSSRLPNADPGPCPPAPPRRYHPLPIPPVNEATTHRTRIPVPTHGKDAVATVDRIAENIATLTLSEKKHTLRPQIPPVTTEALTKPVKPPRPPRHLSPAAEANDGIVVKSRRDPGPGSVHPTPAPRPATYKREAAFTPSAATRRRCEMANVFFLDYYFDLLTYLNDRKQRLQKFKDDMKTRGVPEGEQDRDWKYLCGKERAALRKRRTRIRLANFNIVTQVGQGGYGQVYLAKKNDTKEFCALKKMSKALLHKLGEVNHILTERDILTRTDSPWLVKLLYAFQDCDHVYLAMEYVPGGDMRTLLNNSGVLREVHARFYVAEMIVAVAELHRLGYIHRDLKPENFLIDATGHLKLTDFGLSRGALSPSIMDCLKEKLDKLKDTPLTHRSIADRRSIHKSLRREDMLAYSLVGSPDYMAPEVLTNNQEGYGLAVDYWSIGCILFECLAGYPPFTAPTTDDVWVNVYHWEKVLERPRYSGADEEFNLTDTAWSLVTSLIAKQPVRLQLQTHLQQHPFFHDYSFSHLRTPTSPTPPFIPALKSSIDTTYFDDFSDPKDMAMYKEVQDRMKEMEKKKNEAATNPASGVQKELRNAFVGFTFKHKEANDWDKVDDGTYTGSTMF